VFSGTPVYVCASILASFHFRPSFVEANVAATLPDAPLKGSPLEMHRERITTGRPPRDFPSSRGAR